MICLPKELADGTSHFKNEGVFGDFSPEVLFILGVFDLAGKS